MFRLNFELKNDTDKAIPIILVVDWGDEEYIEDRDHVLLSTEDDRWEVIPGRIKGAAVTANVAVPPGTSYISLHPRYEYGRLQPLLDQLPQKVFTKKEIGVLP
ncbi:MAG: hypothetical protein FWG38_10440, partial [Defluviitaleaceae bacterium]|nr:hypothetical protein [Defluviitaleaceae bacterium]